MEMRTKCWRFSIEKIEKHFLYKSQKWTVNRTKNDNKKCANRERKKIKWHNKLLGWLKRRWNDEIEECNELNW